MAPKRRVDWNSDLPLPSPKRSRRAVNPRVRYPQQHPESGVGKDFHSVSYPLSLLPKRTWAALNQGQTDGGVCSHCRRARPSTAHHKKLFLVAERLSWELGIVSRHMRENHETALWSVNAEFEIFDPVVLDAEVILGGQRSREDPWYPYAGKKEAEMAMQIIEQAEILTDASWEAWRSLADSAVQPSECRDQSGTLEAPIDLTSSTETSSISGLAITEIQGCNSTSRSVGLHEVSPNMKSRRSTGNERKEAHRPAMPPTPPSSSTPREIKLETVAIPAGECSYRSLQDFYCLLDKIERTSFMGARFLEAYAERLHSEVCRDCWFERNVLQGLMERSPSPTLEPREQTSTVMCPRLMHVRS